MKKIMLFVVAIGVMALPSSAAMNFYRDANGHIVAEAADCQAQARLISLTGLPDDPPGGTETEDETSEQEEVEESTTDPETENAPQTEQPAKRVVEPSVAQGAQTVLNAILDQGAEKARIVASETLDRAKQALGLK